MSRKNYINLKMICVLLLSFYIYDANCQKKLPSSNCRDKKLPFGYVYNSLSEKRKQFQKLKKPILDRAYKNDIYPIGVFADFLNQHILLDTNVFGVSIHIGCMKPPISNPNINYYDGSLILIYVLNKKQLGHIANIKNQYYTWDASKSIFSTATSSDVKNWVSNYNNGFKSNILDTVRYELFPGISISLGLYSDKYKGDTKAIFYDTTRIREMFYEFSKCQSNIAYSVKVEFTSILNYCNCLPGTKPDAFKGEEPSDPLDFNRTSIQFSLLDKNGLPFNLENEEDFSRRRIINMTLIEEFNKKLNDLDSIKIKLKFTRDDLMTLINRLAEFDTGQLSPPGEVDENF